ncbi:dynein light chain Tctex-type 5 isoform X1 [Erinaceus europaeus]|uniref:Dynein light chain Tctex-type 5 isoform X1 n=1 Tax=Erinaceus europaeus TaxID=9365 RepID=A0ABM3YMU1_ERIEU|nr:dynein light chain Tctex-type 5 isoform X1 [Erinaceus europaeus]
MMTSNVKDKTVHKKKKKESVSSQDSHDYQKKEVHRHTRGSVNTASCMDELTQQDGGFHPTVRMENTYQLGPTKNFPVGVVNHILKAVLTKHLQEAQYEPESCRLKAKKISEVIKARVKDLMIPRFKLTVIVYIGQLEGQSILIGSRCLWDPKTDAFSSCDFRNFSLFALANVYAVYFE